MTKRCQNKCNRDFEYQTIIDISFVRSLIIHYFIFHYFIFFIFHYFIFHYIYFLYFTILYDRFDEFKILRIWDENVNFIIFHFLGKRSEIEHRLRRLY